MDCIKNMDVKITILQVEVANLRPNPWNTNSVGAQNFEKLKGSIEKLGFFKPILARELDGGIFEILGGEHRWRAAMEQGISTVPVMSVGKINDLVAKQMSLVDNVHVKPLQFNPKLPIWVGQDFNIDPMSSVILQPQPNGELWAVDELVLFSSNTAEVCDELERRYWRWKSQVTIFPDPAGAYRQHARGESDVDIFKEKGFLRVDYPKKHPPIADRVNAVNRMLMSASGETRLYIDPKCKHLIDSLEKVIYKPGSRDMDKTGGIEHSADALGYPVHRRYPVKNRVILGGSR